MRVVNNITFLPPIKKISDYQKFNDFIEDMFQIVIGHFYIDKIKFNSSIVRISNNNLICQESRKCGSEEYSCKDCPFKNKHERFNHIMTGKNDNTRTPGKFSVNRAVRAHWIKPIIENVNDEHIYYFIKPYKKRKRHYFWAKDENYIVIVEETMKSQYYIITAFYIDDYTYYKKYEKDLKNFNKNILV